MMSIQYLLSLTSQIQSRAVNITVNHIAILLWVRYHTVVNQNILSYSHTFYSCKIRPLFVTHTWPSPNRWVADAILSIAAP